MLETSNKERDMKSSGWKGITGGIGLMLLALSGLVVGYLLPETGFGMTLETAVAVFLNGLGILGIRLKLNS